jgi:hypothetical protein
LWTRFFRAAAIPSALLVRVQALVVIAAYVYVCVTLSPDASHWHRYNEFVVRIGNSGLWAVAVTGIWLDAANDIGEVNTSAGREICVILGLLFSPVLLTHALPGMVVYGWLALGLFLVFYIPLRARNLCNNRDAVPFGTVNSATTAVLTGVSLLVFKFGSVIAFQTAANYMVLLYGGQNYVDLIRREFDYRNTWCYVDLLQREVRQLMSFVT